MAFLKDLSRAILTEPLPDGETFRGKPWRPLSAAKPRPELTRAVDLIGRYQRYLEIGTCLLAGKALTRKEWSKAGKKSTDPKNVVSYTEMFVVPEDWIKSAWGRSNMTARKWALQQLATERKSKVNGVKRSLENATKLLNKELEAHKKKFPDAYARPTEEQERNQE